MKKNVKKLFLCLFTIILFSAFSFNVRALEIDDSLFKQEKIKLKFNNDEIIVLGRVDEKILVSDFLDELNLESDTYEANVLVNDEIVSNDSFISNDMNLQIVCDDNTMLFPLKIKGDVDNDGMISKNDVDKMLSNILDGSDVSSLNDVNEDGLFDINDVTYLDNIVNSKTWNSIKDVSDVLYESLDKPSISYVNDEILVTYTIHDFNNNVLNGIEGKFDYNHSLLEFLSIEVNKKSGLINTDNKFAYLFDDYAGGQALITLRFKAIAKGTAFVTLENIIASDTGTKLNLERNYATTDIQIEEYGRGGDDDSIVIPPTTITESDNVGENVNSNNYSSNISFLSNKVNDNYSKTTLPSYVSLSSNNYIKDLNIKDYKINFNKDKLDYSIKVNNKLNKLDLTVLLDDDKARYEIVGNKNLKVGNNLVSIIVTAEDGSSRTYTINVEKKGSNTKKSVNDKISNSSRIVIIILIVLIIIGLIYVIFKDDEEDK